MMFGRGQAVPLHFQPVKVETTESEAQGFETYFCGHFVPLLLSQQ